MSASNDGGHSDIANCLLGRHVGDNEASPAKLLSVTDRTGNGDVVGFPAKHAKMNDGTNKGDVVDRAVRNCIDNPSKFVVTNDG